MSKNRSIVFVLCMFLLKANAQSSLPPVYEINNDTIVYELLPDSCLQILEDGEGKWTIEQVSALPLVDQFHENASGTIGINYSFHTFWLRFRLRNTLSKTINAGFYDVGNIFLAGNERNDYYLQNKNGQNKHIVGGWTTPWSQKQGLKRIGFISTILKPGEEIIVYQRVFNSYHFYPPFALQMAVGLTDKAIYEHYVNDDSFYLNGVHNSFYIGFLIFASLFNLLFFFVGRERVYLYFALYILSLALARSADDLYHVFFHEHPLVLAYSWLYGPPQLLQFFQVLFIRRLLDTPQFVPRWDRALVCLAIATLAANFAYYFLPFPDSLNGYRIYFSLLFLSPFIVSLAAAIVFFVVLYKRKWYDKVLTFAVLPTFCLWAILVLMNWSIGLQSYAFGLSAKGIGLWLWKAWPVIETILLSIQVLSYSWILLHRFSIQRRQITQLAFEKEKERNELIQRQNEELEQKVIERTAELKHSLENLKATQQQLIQSEKMASLGELTAGIAHEIQNPLNFVNNFSDINTELINEQLDELRAGNTDVAIDIANDIKQNEEKINHHGKRADAIVKGMLQHSRTSTGVKEPTDINKLADEYLRLSYHGMRAKDKEFNADIKTQFDENIRLINIVPQDIGRVLLNLFNNAFYAVNEKAKTVGENYQPTLTVATKHCPSPLERGRGEVKITVADNGNGIPQNIIDKIFQPFFTTKPTGQGTGLGLSLTYDIIRAHGGEIKVETKEGKGSEFIIQLPV